MSQDEKQAILTESEYRAALADLAEYERRIAESDKLAQRDSLRVAATLDRLYRDERWVKERNAQRVATAKTARGGRPVDPTSRSQFSTWVRDRYNRIAPRTTYQFLDAQSIRSSFLRNCAINPTAEAQVRPLKALLSVANGQGARIPEVWEIACKFAAEQLRDQPTAEDVKHAIAEWRRLHLPAAQQRQERAEDRAWVKERKAVAAWKELFAAGADEQINAFLDTVRADVEKWQAEHGG
jgi:hypothetical protein